jgi:transglutaminase-like putative cysteine protease
MKLIIKVTSILIVLYFITIVSTQFASAAIVNKEHNRIFTVAEDYLEVEETKITNVTQFGFQISSGSTEAFTIFSPIEGDPEYDEKLTKTLESIKVTDTSGNNIEFTTEPFSSKSYVVKIKTTNPILTGSPYVLNLKYNSYGLVVNAGAIKDIYIPGLPEEYKFEENNISEKITTKLIIPNEFKEVNFVSPEHEIANNSESREINIPQENIVGNTTWIQLGKEQFFSFVIEQEAPKTTAFPLAINTFDLLLPRNIESGSITQEVFYTEFSPEPFSVKEDPEGNLVATFKVPSYTDSLITVKGYAKLSENNTVDFTKATNLSNLTTDFEKYLKEGEYWEVDSLEIQQSAKDIAGEKTNSYEIIQATYDFVVNKIDYSFVKKYGLNERQGALATLNGGAAVCMEYSDLFIALLRAQGIPSRAAFGYGYTSTDYESRSDNTINHQWAEVYIPGLNQWVSIDTTWGEFGNTILGGDLNHFFSHVTSVDPNTPSTTEVSYMGGLSTLPERKMEIIIEKDLTEFENKESYSQQELLNTFENKGATDSIKKYANYYNQLSNDILRGFLGENTNQSIIELVKISLCSIPLLIILILLVKKFRKKKNQKIV